MHDFQSMQLFLKSDHQTFCNMFKVKLPVSGCINQDIVVGCCSYLLMRLSYYIHQGYDTIFIIYNIYLQHSNSRNVSLAGIEPNTFQSRAFAVTARPWPCLFSDQLVIRLLRQKIQAKEVVGQKAVNGNSNYVMSLLPIC